MEWMLQLVIHQPAGGVLLVQANPVLQIEHQRISLVNYGFIMEWLNILIVEDETPLAEMHAQFIRQNGGCRQISLAGTLKQARMMAYQLNPNLILLDNFLPDGRGIELLRELTLGGYCGGIVFIITASDIATVSEALRYGVFNYRIKPLAYDRLSHTLQRFSQWHQALKDKACFNQQHID